jgi:hypothetical protein
LFSARPFFKAFRSIGPLVLALTCVIAIDRSLGGVERGGPYRQEIERPIAVVQAARTARHVVLGCSTSNWFAPALARAWRLGRGSVVDAHMSDCLQACTLAEARRLHQLGLHFETATFGVNTFEYCESYRERRSMQEVELLPLGDTLELARVYAHSEDPLRHAGGWFMNHVSLVYGNTMWLQRHFRKRWFGNETLDPNWAAPPRSIERKPGGAFRCDYAGADRDFGLAATRGALRALGLVADRVQLVLLPDRTYSGASDEARRVRELFRLEHQRMAGELERVQLIDLLDDRLTREALFRDRAHLNATGVKRASAVLAERVAGLGAENGAAPPAGAEAIPR